MSICPVVSPHLLRIVNNTEVSYFIQMSWKKNADADFEHALTQFFPRLWRYCLTLTGKRDRADDLAQSSCLRAIEKANLFEPGTRLDLWMFRLTHRVWLNEIRSDVVRQHRSMLLIDDLDIPDDKLDPEENLLAQERLRQVLNLPEAQRVTVMLAYVEGFSYQETSEILDIPIGTVMSRLAAARARMVASRNSDKSASL
jgi:RNA polymerase sigma-70 factor, ECF subfamily